MILAVAGGKGGVGKSTVALNLGAELDAVVVDADLAMADLAAGRGPDLHDVLAGRAAPLEAVREDGPVALLPCGRTLAGARAADARRLVETVEAVAEAYGRVVVDSPAGMAADAGMPLLAADAAVLVAAPREYALADAIRTRELARELDAGLAAVALNRTAGACRITSASRTESTDSVREALGAPVVAIPDDDRVRRAQRQGWPVSVLAPDSTPADRFRELAREVDDVRQFRES
ncbi:nucleotide-binding protein [Halorussus litoreus]|uniref:nucleotide-binding protein n=1 Tax=Halorussus litoreus TaxID=1710536 RepID=UPI000E260302|nr:chromosome partitioning protein ParA [Halorussus litoreus]